MKRLLCAICSIALLLSLVSCGGAKRDSAEKVVEDAIKAFQSGDQKKTQESWGNGPLDNNDAEEDAQSQEMAKILSKHLTYKIAGSEEDEAAGTATVSVEFTNINMAEVFVSYMGEMFSTALKYAFMPEDQQPSEEEMNQMYMDKFKETVDANVDNTVTSTVEIHLTLVDNNWKIDADEAVVNAMLGGLYATASAMADSFGE